MFNPFSKKQKAKTVEIRNADEIAQDLTKQIEEKRAAAAAAEANPDQAPEAVDGQKRKYHYKGVEIRVHWQYGGRYGKTLNDLGVKRGDPVVLLPEPSQEDPDNVSVYWNGVLIGFMKGGRMRSMVTDWRNAKKPVLAFVNDLYKWFDILLDVAFYGYVPKK